MTLYFGGIKDLKKFYQMNLEKPVKILAMVRRKGNLALENVPELSPSNDLLNDFLNARNRCGKDTDALYDWFSGNYCERFVRQMNSPEVKNMLNRLYAASKNQDIALICFCKHEHICHRSIIAGFMQGAGADVVLESGKDYSDYFYFYQAIKDGSFDKTLIKNGGY